MRKVVSAAALREKPTLAECRSCLKAALPPPAKLRVMRRRVAFWAAVASPLLVIGVAFLIGGIPELLGADCVTYGNNPMHLDNDTVCNELGDLQSGVGWWALILAIVLVPIVFITGSIGAWRAMQRRSR